MKITERVSDRTKIEGVNTTVEIEVDQVGGLSARALETVERLETAIKAEIKSIAEED